MTFASIQGVVREVDGNEVVVEILDGGCGRCHEEGGCGGQKLTQMFCGGVKTYRLANTVGAHLGNVVTIAVNAGSVRHAANMAYVMPMALCLAGAIGGTSIAQDTGAMLGGLAGLIIGFFAMRRRSRDSNLLAKPYLVSRKPSM